SAGRPQCCFTSRGPERKICHARQPVEMNATHRREAMYRCIEQGAEDAGPRNFELAPQLALRAPLRFPNWRQSQKDRPVAQIRPLDSLLAPLKKNRARRFKQSLLLSGEERTDGETPAGREPAERVGEPIGQAREIIECQQVAVVSRNHQLAFLARKGPYWSDSGVDQCLEQL